MNYGFYIYFLLKLFTGHSLLFFNKNITSEHGRGFAMDHSNGKPIMAQEMSEFWDDLNELF